MLLRNMRLQGGGWQGRQEGNAAAQNATAENPVVYLACDLNRSKSTGEGV